MLFQDDRKGQLLTSCPFLLFFCFFLLITSSLESLDDFTSLPRIQRLEGRDTDFARFIADVESNRRRIFNSRGVSPENLTGFLTVYIYVPNPQEDLLQLAARTNIPFSSIATLNRFQNPADLNHGELLLLPSLPGLFIPQNPVTDLERLLYSSRTDGVPIIIGTERGSTEFLFFPGVDFSSTERIFFLNRGFFFPLRNFRITSGFGLRQNPVSGNHVFHQGMDLAAPEGTEVFAARDGIVSETGYDPILGRYIIISHRDNWVSLYGHLSRVETTLHTQVNSGTLIGRVGSTGQSTGPHLHFELRQNGRAQNPEGLLRLFPQGN